MPKVYDLLKYFSLVWISIRNLSARTGSTMLLAGVLLSFSKIMQTVAFFMPLKVLIVLSAGEESKYSSYFKCWLTADQFLAIIIVMVPVSYLLYIFFGIAHRRYADRDMKRQVARAKS